MTSSHAVVLFPTASFLDLETLVPRCLLNASPLYTLLHMFDRSVIVISPMHVIVDEREQYSSTVDEDVLVHQRSRRFRSLREERPHERQDEEKNRNLVAEPPETELRREQGLLLQSLDDHTRDGDDI